MRAAAKWLTIVFGLGLVTAAGALTGTNPATMGFVYLVAVLFLSIGTGLRGGIVASVLATAGYNFFFLPPLHTFHIEDWRNWTALGSFLVASLVSTRMLTAARSQAAEAERRRIEVEATAHLEALKESDELKTALLRAVSHDLTTPLTAIRIHIDSLRRQLAGSSELDSTVSALSEEATRLQRRIDNLLTMARLEGGRFTPRAEPTPPADIFHAVRESLPSVFAARPVPISVTADCPDALVDPSLALEIVVNLVENAHRASPVAAPLELRASAHGEFVRLEILDRGPGVPTEPDVVRRGLGLEIARNLAAASGGAFQLRNREGGGAEATVDLPAAALSSSGDE
jgi:two-component system sensor histidine kinase KdpD